MPVPTRSPFMWRQEAEHALQRDERRCPVCQHIGQRAATLCGYCWTKLTPLPPLEAGEAGDEDRPTLPRAGQGQTDEARSAEISLDRWEGEGGHP
jgi:hypothetical protein